MCMCGHSPVPADRSKGRIHLHPVTSSQSCSTQGCMALSQHFSTKLSGVWKRSTSLPQLVHPATSSLANIWPWQ